MKQFCVILILITSLAILSNKSFAQQVGQGYHLAITPYANLYQKDSVKSVIAVKNQKQSSDKKKNKLVPQKVSEQNKKRKCAALLKPSKKI